MSLTMSEKTNAGVVQINRGHKHITDTQKNTCDVASKQCISFEEFF